MIDSKGSSVVEGDERARDWLAGASVVPDRGHVGEEALEHAGDHTRDGATAVALHVELAFQGVVHRLDELAPRLQEPSAGPGTFVRSCGTEQLDAVTGEKLLELAARVALVRDDHLTRPEQLRV